MPYRSHSQDSFTATADWVANRPAGVEDLDILLSWISFDESATILDTPATDHALAPGSVNPVDSATSGDCRSYLFYKIADSEPSTWSWGLSAATDGSITTVAYSGVDPVDPFDDAEGAGTVTGNTHTSAAIETTIADALVVMFAALDMSGTATPQFSWSGSLAERADWEFGGAIFLAHGFADETIASPGTVQRSATSVTSDEGCTYIVALSPAGEGGESPPPATAPDFTNHPKFILAGRSPV